MTGNLYTVDFFNNLKNTSYKLSVDVVKIIQDLNKVVTENIQLLEASYPKKNIIVRERGDRDRERDYDNNEKEYIKKHNPKNKYPSNKNANMTEDWKSSKPVFKATKLETTVGMDKIVNDIRITLNKLSSKKIETQKETIKDLINSFLKEADANPDEMENEVNKLSNVIFDILVSSTFYSELYAELYADLIKYYDFMKEKTNNVLVKYKETLFNIKAVDPNDDYNGYCSYTKTNDMRKAMVNFIVNSMKHGVFEEKDVIDVIIYLQDLIFSYSEQASRNNEIEEITENIFIFMTTGKEFLCKSELWKEKLIPNIQMLSKLRKEDAVKYQSMSARDIFRYLDIIDYINKK